MLRPSWSNRYTIPTMSGMGLDQSHQSRAPASTGIPLRFLAVEGLAIEVEAIAMARLGPTRAAPRPWVAQGYRPWAMRSSAVRPSRLKAGPVSELPCRVRAVFDAIQ